ncbi:MAG: Ca-activated chloride channel [Acidobacteriota bacterium]
MLAALTPCRAANVGTMRIRVFTTVFLVLVLCAVVVAQDPPESVETVRIESDLVDLKVSVLGFPPNAPPPVLDPKDFVVMEDGVPQEISFFAAADTPFDLVLLLDLSGSNSKKLKMIRNSAKRFVDAARDVDRIALVTFTNRPALYSSFTLDRKKLKKTIDEIDEAYGGTSFWDSLDWVLRDLIPQGSGLRRSAIVVMTDGVDNALPNVEGDGSQIPFEALLQTIRNSETLVFPIYLDTETENKNRHDMLPVTYATAREQLSQIANTCGTPMYKAARLSDLDQVYAQVVRDLSTVYSIGYRPTNKALDGKWRSVEVRLATRTDLFARTKRGYFAKTSS